MPAPRDIVLSRNGPRAGDHDDATRDKALTKLAREGTTPAVQIEAAGALDHATVLVKHLSSDDPLTVLHAVRAIELGPTRTKLARDEIRKTYDAWKNRKDTPLALFIRFSCEAILGLKEKY